MKAPRMGDKQIVFLFLFLFSVLFPVVSAKIVVINSEDWKDVYYGIMYAQYENLPVYFANSPNPAGLFNILPKDRVILIESSSKPFIPNLEAQLKMRGFVIDQKIVLKTPYRDLMPSDIKSFYVVEEDFPYLSIPTGALARATNSWVLIVNDANVNDVAGLLASAKKVVLVGKFKRSIENVISKYATERIDANNKFALSAKIGEEFLKIKKTQQVLIADGKYLEPEMLKGACPVLLVGTNKLPEEILDFIKSNNIRTVVVIGMQLTYVGEKIREETHKKVAVFIKYGMATPGVSKQIYALTMMPLPQPVIKLAILQAIYDPDAKKLMIEYENRGNTGVFLFTTFRVLKNGKELASGGDEQPVFIGAGERLWKSYDISLTELTGNITVEFYTSYGESPENLDSYLTQHGKFGPPYSLPLKISKIADASEVELEKLVYYKGRKEFGVKIKNTGSVKAAVIAKLLDVKINGIPQSLSSRVCFLTPGEEKEVFIPAELDDTDLEENKRVKVEIDFGEKEDRIVKSKIKTLELEIVEGLPIFVYAAGIGIVIVLCAVVLKKHRKKDYGYKYRRYGYR